MIHLFKGAKRVLFFPKSWANSVTNWLLGVRSSDGSIIVKNTANPTSDGSIDLRVNEQRIMRQVRELLESRSLSKSEIIRIQEIVHALLDGVSLKWHDKSFSVDTDWIADIVKKNMIDKPGEDEDAVNVEDEVMYTGVHSPTGTSHYVGYKIVFSITKNKITKWQNQGLYDIYSGTPYNG